MRIIFKISFIILILWSALGFYYCPFWIPEIRKGALIVQAILLLVFIFKPGLRYISSLLLFGFFFLFAINYYLLEPSSNRIWANDVSQLPYAEIRADSFTLQNLRNLKYNSETDFEANYETRTYRFDQLSEADIITSYWAGNAIAHIIVSFGFNDHDFLSFSVETRKEANENYSALAGFFKNYELAYVAADERDSLGLRAIYRNPPERVHLFRVNMSDEDRRNFLMEYLSRINALNEKPAFYNSFTTNCATQVLELTQAYGGKDRYNWRIFFSGFVPEYLYQSGHLSKSLSFEEYWNASLITDKIKQYINDPDFSVKIREGIPKP